MKIHSLKKKFDLCTREKKSNTGLTLVTSEGHQRCFQHLISLHESARMIYLPHVSTGHVSWLLLCSFTVCVHVSGLYLCATAPSLIADSDVNTLDLPFHFSYTLSDTLTFAPTCPSSFLSSLCVF